MTLVSSSNSENGSTGVCGYLLNWMLKRYDQTHGLFISLSSSRNARSIAERLKTVGSLLTPPPPFFLRLVFQPARTYIGLFEMSPIRLVLMFPGSIGARRSAGMLRK